MHISFQDRIRNLFVTTILLAVSNTVLAIPLESGVSHELAIARAARLSNLRYQLSFMLKEHESAVAGTETLSFESNSSGDLPIDYRDGVLQSATLNGHPIPTELENGHLHLPVIAGQNTLTVAFTSNAAPVGKAITRYEDKDDGNEYIYISLLWATPRPKLSTQPRKLVTTVAKVRNTRMPSKLECHQPRSKPITLTITSTRRRSRRIGSHKVWGRSTRGTRAL
jgi:hypothetical protein